MTDIVERLRQNAGPSGEWGELADRLQIEAADEIERLRASERSAWNAAVTRDEEIERLRTELAAAKSVIENIVESEVEPLKALLCDALESLEFLEVDSYPRYKRLCDRIRAALGEDNEPVQKEPSED